MTIHIASVVTCDLFDKVYLLLNSLKHNKRPDTTIEYYLFISDSSSFSAARYTEYFQALIDDHFQIHFEDVAPLHNRIHAPHTIVYYVRYLFPQLFPDLDEIIHIDAGDAFCVGPGLEAFWELNIEDRWLGAVIDPTWQYCPMFKSDPVNCGTDHYFNDGVILMNLKKIREDCKDAELAQWCLNWDDSKLRRICFAQTLANYVLKDKVKLINSRYNNTLLASLGVTKDCYTYVFNQEGWLNPLDSLNNAVIVHFCGQNKPWSSTALNLPLSEYPYKEEAVQLWRDIEAKYGKQ